MKARSAFLLAAIAAAMLLVSVPAGAVASNVGQVTVSNPSPARASEVEVTSNGWRAGTTVSITLSGRVLGHATADDSGAIRARVSVPGDAPRFASLAAIGTAASGVPQQISTNLEVVGSHHEPASPRPWTVICLLLAIATVLLLASVRSERSASAGRAAPA
jgi:hypothetical protein